MLQLVLFTLCGLISISAGGHVTVKGNDLVHNGQKVFLSGANTAWVAYGYDFGNHQYQYRRTRYLELMDKVKNAGGNSMRTWVHIEGATSPEFDGSGHVTALDKDGSFISDFQQYLDDAQQRNILIFPTLWNGALKQNHAHFQGLVEDTSKLQSYLDKALIPWVKAVKDHPALGGWDIINEMEGIIIPGTQDSEPCFDTTFLANSGAGWAGKTHTAKQLLRFVNWQVDAIRRTDPTALVTAGSWSQKSQSDQWGDRNIYSDTCLTKAGGKAQGTLTFYSTHCYDWQRKFSDDAPFLHSAADYKLDKPLVVAEFNSARGAGMTIEAEFTYLYTHGYSGAWSWHANADGGDTDPTDVQMRGIAALKGKHGAGGQVALSL
ncbi:mannan endo-1,4-beta-mannosidase-like [Littorina saxatilis]|uniref:Glycoside hydrolase family 5 protein n=1 Tax=Littorina saxatilis TaxID=31220 RepID=A0AAN9BG04_9CAEN